MGLDNFEEKRA